MIASRLAPKGQASMNAECLPPLGFIGGGKMASALVAGILRAGLAKPADVIVGEPVAALRESLASQTGVQVTPDNAAAVSQSKLIVLAVKPQVMSAVLAELKPLVRPDQLIVSVAAGVTLRQLGEGLGVNRRVVRVMPNTPCLVGAGASGYCLGPSATAEDGKLVERLLGAVGVAYQVPESLLDAVTGLSASGPAFVALVIEALSDGGVRAGLPRDVAAPLAAQTVLGTARMVLEMGLHPAQVKDMVASPGGTTIAGVHALERGGLRASLMDAVLAAAQRARELGQ
jgi:pyrroline-5-carboxylate reductase